MRSPFLHRCAVSRVQCAEYSPVNIVISVSWFMLVLTEFTCRVLSACYVLSTRSIHNINWGIYSEWFLISGRRTQSMHI